MRPDDVLEDLADVLGLVERVQDGVDGAGADLLPALDELDELLDDGARGAHLLVGAVERQPVAAEVDRDAEPLTEEEIEEIVDDAIAEVGATSMADLGRVMADVMPQIAGRADGSTVSQIVREKLA